jgi:hypothetical protein
MTLVGSKVYSLFFVYLDWLGRTPDMLSRGGLFLTLLEVTDSYRPARAKQWQAAL